MTDRGGEEDRAVYRPYKRKNGKDGSPPPLENPVSRTKNTQYVFSSREGGRSRKNTEERGPSGPAYLGAIERALGEVVPY